MRKAGVEMGSQLEAREKQRTPAYCRQGDLGSGWSALPNGERRARGRHTRE